MAFAIYAQFSCDSKSPAQTYSAFLTEKTRPIDLPCKDMSLPVGKPTICIGENKGADQLRGNRKADQRLCFRYMDSTISVLPKYEIHASSCYCAVWFVSDLFGNHIVGLPTRRLLFYQHVWSDSSTLHITHHSHVNQI